MQALLNPGLATSPQHLATQMLGSSPSSIWDNPFLTGGLLLLFIGSVLAYLRTFLTYIGEYLMKKLIVTVEIPEKEEAYQWVMHWLAEQPLHPLLASQNFTLTVATQMSASTRYRRERNLEVVHKETPKLKYYPGIGLHMAYFKGKLLWILKSTQNGNDRSGNRYNSQDGPEGVLLIATWGRTKDVIHSLIEDAMNVSLKRDQGSTIIYNVDTSYGGWKRAISRPDRSLGSVILDTNLADELVADASEFLNSSEWYSSLGIPYRRAYLFHGKPGCGKTSFVAALAAKLNWCVCVLTLSDKHMNDAVLNSYLVDAPQNAIILLEDVDVAFANQDRTKKKDNNNPYAAMFSQPRQVTFSGLLNAIDGIASQQGRLFVMTTNHKEHLDPALIRPGRVDKVVYFSLASVNQIRRMFLRFYPEEEDLATKFAERIGENRVSMAMLQGFFLGYKKNPLGSYQDIQILLDQIDAEEKAERKREKERKKLEAEEAAEEKKQQATTATSTSTSTTNASVTNSANDSKVAVDETNGKGKECSGEQPAVLKDAANVTPKTAAPVSA